MVTRSGTARVAPVIATPPVRRLALTPQLLVIGVVGGVLSGLLGVGGGVVMVPLMVFTAGIDQRTAHAVSLGAVVAISIGGIATYGAAGNVRVPEAIALTAGAVFGARIGARALEHIDQRRLALCFSAVMLLSAVLMVAR